MYLDFKPLILETDAKDIGDVWVVMEHEIARLEAIGARRFAFVSGVVLSAGRFKISECMSRLDFYTRYVASNFTFPVFSAASIIDASVSQKIGLSIANDSMLWVRFVQLILQSGKVTDVVMEPCWAESVDTRAQRSLAQSQGLRLFVIDRDTNCIVSM